MTPKNEWSPAQGPGAAPEQVPATQPRIAGSGADGRGEGASTPAARRAPSQGPVRTEPGGPGGEPSGHAIPPAPPTAVDEP
jgi:hypothetical protein